MKKNKLYIAVAGNIGVGKTTLTRMLGERLGWKTFYERVLDNPYLSDRHGDMKRWSFHLQVFFLSNRFIDQKQITEWPDSCIQDRSIYEDVEIFAHTLHKNGNMSDVDYKNYQDLFAVMVSYLRKPDLIIYLRSTVDNLLKHIQKRGRDYEKSIDPAYLAELNDAYESWIERAKKDNFKVIVFDMNHRDFEHNEEDFNLLYHSIKELESQTWIKGV